MTSNQLKIIALITMTIDHIGVILLPQYRILRIIGRLSFPIFSYLIAEGCFYTHDKKRYLGGIALLACACQLVYFFVLGSLEQSILTTFTLSILVVYALQYLVEKRTALAGLLLVCAVVLAYVCCFVLPGPFVHWHWRIDYGFWGVMLPALCYLPRVLFPAMQGRCLRWASLAFLLLSLVLVALSIGGVQWYSLLSVVLIAFYNGKRGTWSMKYLFYIYYPAHLVVIYALYLVL